MPFSFTNGVVPCQLTPTRTWSSIAVPIPDSYPRFFDKRFLPSIPKSSSAQSHPTPHYIPIYSSVVASSTLTSSSGVLSSHLRYVNEFIRHGQDISLLNSSETEGSQIGMEELKELREDLIAIVERYNSGEVVENGDDVDDFWEDV